MASRSSSNRFASSSGASIIRPVTFPPGLVIFAARPAATGSSPINDITIGIVDVARRAARMADLLIATITSGWAVTSSCASSAHRLAAAEMHLDAEDCGPRETILRQFGQGDGSHRAHEPARMSHLARGRLDGKSSRRLRSRLGCPPSQQPGEKCSPPHSITSSARARSVGGTSRPRAFAVLRLTTNSNPVGCSTGIFAGLSPLRIWPM